MITNIRTTSSIISFKADTLRIKISGTNVVQRPVGDTSGICWKFKLKKNASNTYII